MIYMLEDDDNIRNFVLYALTSAGMEAEGFAHPQTFWDPVNLKTPSLVLLDIMLPEEDGLQILDKLRRSDVMMLTAKSTEYDKAIALDRSADDYMVKPFGTMELIARIRPLLRRFAMPEHTDEHPVYESYK